MDISLSKKEIWLAIGIAVFDAAFLGGATWFLTGKIIDTSSQLQAEKGKLASLEQSWQSVGAGKNRLQFMQAELDKIDNSYVSPDGQIDFINQIETLAQQAGINYQISLVSLGDASQNNSGNSLVFQVTGKGGFDQVMHFLKFLENDKYYIRINSLQMSGSQGAAATGQAALPDGVSAVINLSAFME